MKPARLHALAPLPNKSYFREKLQVPMEHSGATSWSLNDAADDAANRAVSWGGHVNPNDENRDTTCRKSTPMPSALRFTPFQRATPRRASTAAV